MGEHCELSFSVGSKELKKLEKLIKRRLKALNKKKKK